MRADFALVDQAFLRFVHEFDRVLDGQDVAVFVFVDVVDHRRQRGRFAEPVGPVTSTMPRAVLGNFGEILGRSGLPASAPSDGMVRTPRRHRDSG